MWLFEVVGIMVCNYVCCMECVSKEDGGCLCCYVENGEIIYICYEYEVRNECCSVRKIFSKVDVVVEIIWVIFIGEKGMVFF